MAYEDFRRPDFESCVNEHQLVRIGHIAVGREVIVFPGGPGDVRIPFRAVVEAVIETPQIRNPAVIVSLPDLPITLSLGGGTAAVIVEPLHPMYTYSEIDPADWPRLSHI